MIARATSFSSTNDKPDSPPDCELREFAARRKLLAKPADVILVIRVGWWIIAASVLIKLLPLHSAFALLKPLFHSPTIISRHCSLQNHIYSSRMMHIVAIADRLLNLNRLFFTPTCWKRSAVLFRFLSLDGANPRVVFGAKLISAESTQLDGHAWIEVCGKPVYEETMPDFTPMFTYPNSNQNKLSA